MGRCNYTDERTGATHEDMIESFMEERTQMRQHLQVAISAVQLEIETTDNDETRNRMRVALKALQKMAALL